MKEDGYLQSKDGKIYKIMSTHLLQLSPWKDGDDRRLYEYNDKDSNIETIPTDVFMNFNKDPNQQEEYSVLQGNLAKFFNNSGGD